MRVVQLRRWLRLLTWYFDVVGRVATILAEIQLDQGPLLRLRQGVLELQLLRQKVRSGDPKFLLADFLVRNLSDLAMERDNL